MKTLSRAEISAIIKDHAKWLSLVKSPCACREYFKNVDLSHANFARCNLSYMNFRNSDLRYADFSSTNLTCSVLANAQLQYADMRNANLADADLVNANLYMANLTEAHCCGTDFLKANLIQARVDLTVLDPNNKPNGIRTGFRKDKNGMLIGYRTRYTKYIGGYKDDTWYSADWFSTCPHTDCHPGLYVWPTATRAKSWWNNMPLIRVKIRPQDVHKVGDKYRCKAFYVDGAI